MQEGDSRTLKSMKLKISTFLARNHVFSRYEFLNIDFLDHKLPHVLPLHQKTINC